MSFFGISFPFLEFWKTINFFGRYYFVPNIILYSLFLFFIITGQITKNIFILIKFYIIGADRVRSNKEKMKIK